MTFRAGTGGCVGLFPADAGNTLPDLEFYPINRKISITFNAKATVHPQRNNERQQRTTP